MIFIRVFIGCRCVSMVTIENKQQQIVMGIILIVMIKIEPEDKSGIIPFSVFASIGQDNGDGNILLWYCAIPSPCLNRFFKIRQLIIC